MIVDIVLSVITAQAAVEAGKCGFKCTVCDRSIFLLNNLLSTFNSIMMNTKEKTDTSMFFLCNQI